jgi:tetratricopeptide (TPR) repeat protein
MSMLDASVLPSAVRTLGALALACSFATVPACKSQKGTKGPGRGPSAEEIEEKIEEQKRRAKANTLIDIANADLAEGRYVSARRRAEEALQANPDDSDAHAVLGAAHWRAGDYAASTSALEKAIELDPTNYGASLGLARNLQAAGQHRRAIELCDALIAEDKEQLDPYLTKLQSQYVLLDAAAAEKTLDEVFKRMPAEDPQLPLIQAQAAFLRPMVGKGKLCDVAGKTGKSDVGIEHGVGAKYSSAIVGGEFSRVLLLENTEEAVIDADLAKVLGLQSMGKFRPLGSDVDEDVVLVPEVAFGDLKIKNVPALVRSLAAYDELVSERPGMLLGRQVMSALGTITFDFPRHELVVAKDPPAAAPAGTTEVPLLLVSMFVLHAPAIPMRLEGSEHEFWAYFGYNYKAGVAVTQKHYFKSGHLPRDVDPPDDPSLGLKMVYVDGIEIGGKKLSGTGGLVLVNEPPDQTLGLILDNTRFELGGYINLALIDNWSVTYAIPAGKAYLGFGG